MVNKTQTIICQRCGKNPAEKQDPNWVPICEDCDHKIIALPHKEMLQETQKEWDKFLDNKGG